MNPINPAEEGQLSAQPSTHNFQVNLDGIINLLSNHLYSSPRVFVRELLQNAVDAITARKKREPELQGNIHFQVLDGENPSIVFEDNGIGLNEEELFLFLASIGSSSKREPDSKSDDFIGQFGIGLLSCFMVTQEITMITRSAKGGPAYEWRGRFDGTFTTKVLSGDFEVGTKVYFKAKEGAEEFVNTEMVEHLVKHYGDLLPYPIFTTEESGATRQINSGEWPFDKDLFTDEDLLKYGEQQFGEPFIAVIPLQTNDGRTKGAAFIPAYTPPMTSKPEHRIYLKRMLLSEEDNDILPSWAFFVRAIINSRELRPTASREAIYKDAELSRVRRQLGRCVRNYLMTLHQENPALLAEIIDNHRMPIKRLACDDDKFFRIIMPYLKFPTNFGDLTLKEYRAYSPILYHLPDDKAFNQVRHVAKLHQMAIINSRFDYDEVLIRKMPKVFGGVEVTEVDPHFVMERLATPNPQEAELLEPVLQQAIAALSAFECKTILRKFDPASLPVLHHIDPQMDFARRARHGNNNITENWVRLIKTVTQNKGHATLCLNANNPVIQRLAKVKNPKALKSFIHLLYIQSLLLGDNHITPDELQLMSDTLGDLLDIQEDTPPTLPHGTEI